jgi:hypothetical protein
MEPSRTLNFIVTGQLRCGASVVQTSICLHPSAHCHADLLHADEEVRQQRHYGYFGAPPDGVPLHFVPRLLSAEQYLTSRIFDRPENGERAVGVWLPYMALATYDLWEYLHDRCCDGDFALIQVNRNPLACYVSWKQAEKHGWWYQLPDSAAPTDVPDPIDFDPREFADFCRQHLAHEAKVRQFCDDRLEIDYQELFLNYHEVMAGVFSYLDLPPYPRVQAGVRRLRNRRIRERIYNFAAARLSVSGDLRRYFDARDLF